MLQLPPFRYQSNNAAVYAGAALAAVAITSSTSFSIPENTTTVATLTATGGGTITWSLIGGADIAKFSIGSSSGALTFSSAPDFETPTDANADNIYLVQVQASNGVTSDTKSLSVTVTDVAETALDLDFTATTTLDSRVTFTRTSAATYFNSAGVLQTAAANVPRFDYNPATLAAKGLLLEEARTNVVWPNRDLTNARWVKTNCTAALSQVGLDGVTNSASLLTATAANATCLQVTSIALSSRYQSAYVKRITGSGVVNMTMNGGTNWTPVTVTSSWTRVEIPTASIANPSVGFQLVTSGDAIAVDCVQNETGVFATSAMITTTGTFARTADIATMTGTNFSSWYNQSAGTFVVGCDLFSVLPANQGIISADDASTSNRIYFRIDLSNPIMGSARTSSTTMLTDIGTIVPNATTKLGIAFAPNDIAGCQDGGAIFTSLVTVPATVMTQLRIGTDASNNRMFGHVRRIQFWNTRKTNAELQALTT